MADFEENRKIDAEMDFKEYTYTIAEEHRWQVWAYPKNDEGKIETKTALTGKDLIAFVNEKLFPYLQDFKDINANEKPLNIKLGQFLRYSPTVFKTEGI